MTTAPAEEPHPQATAANRVVRFTQRGEAALDTLAADLADGCSGTPEEVAAVLDQVLHADINDLAAALSSIAGAPEDRGTGRADSMQLADSPDAVARRRLVGRHEGPPAGGPSPSRPLDR